MTKEKMEEKIVSLLGYCSEAVINSINDIFEEFTRTNVCIPRGENRHPYADILHEALEGENIQEKQCNEWCNVVVTDGINMLSEYRIKPHEPIYEYQWYGVDKGQVYLVNNGKFCTKDEAHEYHIRVEETKRVRQ